MATSAAEQTVSRWPFPGLSEADVARRREQGEGNIAPPMAGRSYTRILIQNAFTPVNVVLFAIVITLLVLGAAGDALMTAGLVFANVAVGVVQESRAKRQLDRIALLTRPRATVVRDSREQEIEPAEIVRGDLLVVRPGDQIMVDGEVIGSGELRVDESLLTGESDPMLKRPGDTVYSGTFCVAGSGIFEARRVGAAGVAQEITAGARSFRTVKTPLQREIGIVIQVLAILMLALGVQVIETSRREGVSLLDNVRAAAVIAALVPQGLVFMVTVTYAVAALRMAGKGALIQRMNAVESTSHVDTLCLDKTGTLTTNQLKLESLLPFDIGEAELRRLIGDFSASAAGGNRTTAALAEACGGQARRAVEEAAFSSETKWSALSFDGDGLRGTYVLGAPEAVLTARESGPERRDIERQVAEWTALGLRVLLFAHREDLPGLHDSAGRPRLPSALEPLGLLCLSDELRPEARETVRRFAEAGIRLKVISGDNPETVTALVRQAGIERDITAVSGSALTDLNKQQIERVAEDTTVFGRITPQQKRDLVVALKRRGHYVAMIGDGVNDVLALKEANLAVSVRSGSQVARNVADIVLINDSFAALPAAFQEGQRILRGMQDIIRLFLVRTIYVSLIILITSLLGEAFPVTPRHNGVLALLTVGIPTVALALWARPGATPRRLLPSVGHFVVPAALTITGVSLVVFMFYLSVTDDVALARTALTTTTVLCGLLLIPFLLPPTPAWTGGAPLSGDWRPTVLAVAMLLLYIVILRVEPLRRFAELGALSLVEYTMIGLVVLGWAVLLRSIWRFQVGAKIRRLAAMLAHRRRPERRPNAARPDEEQTA
jgi:cation-transporting ATPase E